MVRPAFNTVALVNSVGQLVQPMTTGSQAGVTLRDDWTIDQAVAHLRTLSPSAGSGVASSQVMDFYVLDSEERLVGIVSARQLLFSDPTLSLSAVMGTSIVSLKETDSLLAACELFSRHRLLAIPVITKERKFLGTLDVSVYTDDHVDLNAPKTTDDMFQLIGVHLDHAKNASPFAGYKVRMPWLLANISGGLMCAVLASFFDRVLSQFILLAAFIPVVLGAVRIRLHPGDDVVDQLGRIEVAVARRLSGTEHQFSSGHFVRIVCPAGGTAVAQANAAADDHWGVDHGQHGLIGRHRAAAAQTHRQVQAESFYCFRAAGSGDGGHGIDHDLSFGRDGAAAEQIVGSGPVQLAFRFCTLNPFSRNVSTPACCKVELAGGD